MNALRRTLHPVSGVVLSSVLLSGGALALAGCTPSEPATSPPPVPVIDGVPSPAPSAVTVPRDRFNFLAADLALPLFWENDANGDGRADPSEIAVLLGVDDSAREDWITKSGFTPRYVDALHRIEALHRDGPPAGEAPRLATLRKELAQGRPTLIRTRFHGATAEDRAIVEHVLAAAKIVERIYQKQVGSWDLRAKIPATDPVSTMVYYRNQGPWCAAPNTENDPGCNAVDGLPKRVSGLYPASLQADGAGFCDALKEEKDAEKLRHQFYVVRESTSGGLTAVPYHEAYREEMTAVSKELSAAAAAITSEDEKAFKRYLEAAAKAFLDDSWEAADEAWAAMNVHNSKWYLRIGPDEVYFEPCALKAGFHVSFALINQDSLTWQRKLDPVKGTMEDAIAKLSGPPYRARKVAFHLPDFIDIVLNAGDSRSSHGATIGQSLPNWGPVAEEGRGRTVAMTNLYTDPDSRADSRMLASSMFCADTMPRFVDDPAPLVMSTVMHEAAHNLGPAHDYKVGGKTDRAIFGGPTASTLEELKAQTAALFLPGFLHRQDPTLISAELVEQAHVRDVAWAFGHISRGMVEADGKPKPYSQLAAIQFGFLRERGAIEWRPNEKAANGTDVGCVSVKTGDAFEGPTEELMRIVGGIKAKGDVKGADKLRADYVDSPAVKPLLDTIQERWLRAPKASFVYSIEL